MKGEPVAETERTLARSPSPVIGVLLFRTGIRDAANHSLVQHLTALVQGDLDHATRLVHDALHRLTGLVDGLFEQAPSLIGYLSYRLVHRPPDLAHRLP